MPNGGFFVIEDSTLTPKTDPYLSQIRKVFPGDRYSARIGRRVIPNGGGRIDQLVYQTVYSPSNSFYILRFAVILDGPVYDNSHNSPNTRPRFTVEIKDHLTQTLIDPVCGAFDVCPGPGTSGWDSIQMGTHWVLFKNWSSIGIDLSTLGSIQPDQILDIVYTIHGCAYTAHTAYAYISAVCSQMSVSLSGCAGANTVTLTGPPGFKTYEWYGPICPTCSPTIICSGPDPNCTITNANEGDVYRLNMTTFTNCAVNNNYTTIAFTHVVPAFSSVMNCVNNQSTFTDNSTSTNPSQPIVSRYWRFDGGALEGPFAGNTINHTFTTTGPHEVKVLAYSQDGCVDSVANTVTVDPAPVITNPTLDNTFCSGGTMNLTLAMSDPGAYATWTYSVLSGSATVTPNPAGQSGTYVNDQIVNTGVGNATVSYTYTPKINSCVGVPVSGTITVQPLPSATISGSVTVCVGETDPGITFTGLLGTKPYTFDYNINGGPTQSISTTITDDVAIVAQSAAAPGTFVYNLLSVTDANGCTRTMTGTVTIIVNLLPTATISGTTGVCTGGTAPDITFTATAGVAPFTFFYNINGGPQTSVTAATGNTATVSQSTATPGSFVYNLMSVVDGNACSQTQTGNATITVHPLPTATLSGTTAVCQGSTPDPVITFTGAAGTAPFTFNYNVNGGTTQSVTTVSGNSVTVSQPTSTPGPFVYNLESVRDANSCVQAQTGVVTVTVNPLPTATIAGDAAVCLNAASPNITYTGASGTPPYTFTYNINGGTNQTITTTSGNSVTLPAPTNVAGTFVYNLVSVQDGTSTMCSQLQGGSATVTVYTLPTALITGTTAVCQNSSPPPDVTFTGATGLAPYTFFYKVNAGVTQNVTTTSGNSVTVSQPTGTPGTYVYTLESVSDAHSCSQSQSGTATITVHPTPHVTNTQPNPICSGATFSLPLTSDVTGTGFTWTASCNPAGSVTGFTATQSTYVTSISDPLTNTTGAPATVTYTITPHANNCDGPSSDITVTVNPIPTVNAVQNQVVCHNTSTTLVHFTGIAAGTVYSWTNNTPSIGLVASGTGDIAAFTATNTSADPVTATITVTPSFTNLGVTCTGTPISFTITVNPIPTVNSIANQTVCNNTSTTLVHFTGSVNNTLYSWTNSNPSIGLVASGTGDIAAFTATNISVTPVTATITVTPSLTYGGVTCTGTSVTFTITVNPTPHLTSTPLPPICSGTLYSATLASDVSGAMYTWTATCAPVGSVTGFTATQSTQVSQISEILTNTTNGIANVNYLITAHANNCAGPATTYTVTVYPKPGVIFPASPPNPQQVCSGATFTSVPLQSNVTTPTVSYAWTAQAFDPVNPTAQITGFTTPNSGNPIPGENISSSLLVPGVIKYTVTATFTAAGVGCAGDPSEYQVIVNPSPTVALNPSDPTGQTICSGLTSQTITFTPNVTPTTYTWIADQASGVTGYTTSGTTDNIPPMTLATTGSTQGYVKYKVTPTYQGSGTFTCPGGVSYSTIYVNPLPSPLFTYTSPVCEYGPPISYQTAAVAGNFYEWDVTGASTISGGNTNQVTVSWGAAGTGTLRVKETINATGCINYYPPIAQNPAQIVLQQRPVPTLTGPSSVCENSVGNLYVTDVGNNSNYTWLISGGTITAGGNGNPTATVTWTNPGTTNWIEVNYQNALGCPGYPAKRNTIQVNPLPVSTFTGTTSVCPATAAPYLYTANSGPPATYNWTVNPASYATIANTTVSPVSINWNTTGSAVLRLDALTSFGCTSFSTQPVTINPLPVVSITPCFDVVTNRSAQKFLLKGGRPLLTATPMQGEYIINPATPALTSDASGNYYFEPVLVPGTNTVTFNISYRYTSSQYGCLATSPTSVSILVHGANPACGTTMTDYRDNPPTTYRTSFIGGKCWMTENLRYGTLLFPMSTPQTDNCTTEKYCLQTDANCTTYGGLYQWDELIQYGNTAGPAHQGVCPPGWHIPSAADFQALIDANMGNGMAGSMLKDMYLNPRGFEALIKGMAYLNTAWAFTATDTPAGTLFWTSTPGSGNRIITRGVNSAVLSVQYYEAIKADAFPVRCVKD